MSVKLEAQDIRLEYQQPRTGSRLVALDDRGKMRKAHQ